MNECAAVGCLEKVGSPDSDGRVRVVAVVGGVGSVYLDVPMFMCERHGNICDWAVWLRWDGGGLIG